VILRHAAPMLLRRSKASFSLSTVVRFSRCRPNKSLLF
jgi:hypothetical protein